MNKAKKISSVQELLNVRKKSDSILKNNLPSYKEVMHMRSLQIASDYLALNSNPNKKKISIKDYSKLRDINKTTLSKAIKEVTNENTRVVNPRSNNIAKYHKQIIEKAAFGIELNSEEQETLKKIRDSYTIINPKPRLTKNVSSKTNNVSSKTSAKGGCINNIPDEEITKIKNIILNK